MARPRPTPDPSNSPDGLGFLLSQVGFHSATRFAERLEPLGYKPAHVGILGLVQRADGLSQQSLGERLGMFPSRLVGLIDELQGLGLVERRNSPTDRRMYALYVTEAGRKALQQINEISREHQATVFASLDEGERDQLASFLRRIAAEQGLAPGVHPGLRPGGRGYGTP